MTRSIALISEHASPLATLGGVDAGGQNVYVAHLARQLAAMGDRVDVYTRKDRPDLPDVVDWVPGVRVVHVPAGPAREIPKEDLLPYMGDFTSFMLRRLQRDPVDIVHANFFLSGLVACEIKEALGIPFVITFHALGRVRRQFHGAGDGFPDARFAIEDRIVAAADAIVAEAPQDEEDLVRLYNADPARISIVPCGFDPAEFAPASRPLARLELGLDPAERILLQLGRMVPRKGIDTVIRATGQLLRDDLPVRLVVVGGPERDLSRVVLPELERLRAIAREEGVADRVTFVGRREREELAAYYNAADVFVSTPWYEPFGITPLEAMACGTPVLGSNVGGIKFTVRDGETGYLVPPNDPAALAERAAHLFRNPKLLSILGRQAIRRVNDLFTWERVAAGIAAIYEEVLVSGRRSQEDVAARLATVDRRLDELTTVIRETKRRSRSAILDAADAMCMTFARERTVIVVGAGGAPEAQRLVGSLVGRFRVEGRPPLSALALGTDSAVVAALRDDGDPDGGLARQLESIGRTGDLLVGLSTAGNAPGLVRAFAAARDRGIRTVALVGGDGGRMRSLADVSVVVPSSDPHHVREVHGALVHVLAELVETRLAETGWFGEAAQAAAGSRSAGESAPAGSHVPTTTTTTDRDVTRGRARVAGGPT
ncbi:MAG TPA: glycosyltransferase [Candidatus Limnocylindrales bacterium]|nr:glycosyltransferase [Candidatus Limnocylindrales bacterium]